MSALREAAQQALEALEGFVRFAAIHSDGPDASDKYLAEDYAEEAFLKTAKILPDLRAALAQQEQEPPEQPIDYFAVQRIANERGLDYNRFAAALRDYAALAQQEQEQEPVAEKFRAAFDAPPAPTPDQSAINWLKARPYIEAFIDGMGYDMTLTDERVRFEAREKVDVLAQQEQEQEPVAWGLFAETDGEWQLQYPAFVGDEFGKRNAEAEAAACNSPLPIKVRPLYTHPPRREAQQEQEPVEIKPPNPEGATQCIVRWLAETPAGWVGAWDREALERFTAHPPRRETEQEPVAWAGYDLDGMAEAFSRVIEAHHSSKYPFQNPIDMDAKIALRILRGLIPAMKTYTHPPRRETEQEQEPVAWMVYTQDGKSVCVTDNPADFTDEHRALPLYAHPPRREWQSLTDEEMHGLYRRAGLEAYYPRDGVVQYEYERRLDAYARAVEAALRSKNHD